MNVDLEFCSVRVQHDVMGCQDCKPIEGSTTVYSVCGWHENLVAASAAVERVAKDAEQ